MLLFVLFSFFKSCFHSFKINILIMQARLLPIFYLMIFSFLFFQLRIFPDCRVYILYNRLVWFLFDIEFPRFSCNLYFSSYKQFGSSVPFLFIVEACFMIPVSIFKSCTCYARNRNHSNHHKEVTEKLSKSVLLLHGVLLLINV